MAPISEVAAEVWTGEPGRGDLINVIVRVVDADGNVGEGEAWWGIGDPEEPARAGRPMAAVINDLLAPRVIGREAGHIERLWHELVDWGQRYGDQGLFTIGVSGLDLALWDLHGRRLGLGVCDLLGGPVTDTIPAYASLPWLLDGDLVLRETTRAVDAGFAAVKLHETDPEYTAVLRREFGDDLTIMVDVNGHFDPVEAVEHGRRLAELGVLWFEEPVSPMRDHAAITRVGRALAAGDPACALAGGENEYTVEDFQRLLATGALTYLQPEITKIGGLTAARRIAALAEAANVALCPHNFRLGPSFSASIHWAFTSPSSRWIEVPWVPEAKRFAHPTTVPPLVDGAIAAPTGLGLSLDDPA